MGARQARCPGRGTRVRHLLVTNDFPPKVGGIQNYLWELWRRLPPDSTTVLTTPHRGWREFDEQQPIRVIRDRARVLLPTRALVRRVDHLAAELDVDLVLLDPAVPLGIIGPRLERPFGVIVHGAEVTVPGRIPIARSVLGNVLRGARVVIAAGGYPAAEARRCAGIDLPTIIVPPGVDIDRFVPLDPGARDVARDRLGLDPDAPLVLGLSRLVPRKGFDVLIDAAAILAARWPTLQLVIAGTGRDRARLQRRAERRNAPVRFLGRVDDANLAPLLGAADVFAMLCRDRWSGLEQEGFGIVFLEAAACGVPAVAGRSGGSAEAVEDGDTGSIVDDPRDVEAVVAVLDRLLGDRALRGRLGEAARRRVESGFTHDQLARMLHEELERLGNQP
jgi:phosphatidylinositol alpha-1,6-mannosyltransferase